MPRTGRTEEVWEGGEGLGSLKCCWWENREWGDSSLIQGVIEVKNID